MYLLLANFERKVDEEEINFHLVAENESGGMNWTLFWMNFESQFLSEKEQFKSRYN